MDKWQPELFTLLSQAINDSKEEQFCLYGNIVSNRYYYLDGYRYWRIEEILNRTKADNIIYDNGISYEKLSYTISKRLLEKKSGQTKLF